MVYVLFFVILTMNLLINFDHGVMPAGALEMKKDLNLTNGEYGWLGSVVFIGLTLGKLSYLRLIIWSIFYLNLFCFISRIFECRIFVLKVQC